jgi:amidase
MGLQIMGPNQSELSLLQLAHAYDQATGWVKTRPSSLLKA